MRLWRFCAELGQMESTYPSDMDVWKNELHSISACFNCFKLDRGPLPDVLRAMIDGKRMLAVQLDQVRVYNSGLAAVWKRIELGMWYRNYRTRQDIKIKSQNMLTISVCTHTHIYIYIRIHNIYIYITLFCLNYYLSLASSQVCHILGPSKAGQA